MILGRTRIKSHLYEKPGSWHSCFLFALLIAVKGYGQNVVQVFTLNYIHI